MPSAMFVFLDDLFNSLLFSFFCPCERDKILQGKLLEHMARYDIIACKLPVCTPDSFFTLVFCLGKGFIINNSSNLGKEPPSVRELD